MTGGIHFHQAPPAGHPTPTPRQLPAALRAFINRTDELRQLNAIITRPQGGDLIVSVQVVAGTAGAGKTSLALHWAHRIKHEFPDGQLFVNLRGYDPGEPVGAQQALRGFLRALGVPTADIPEDLDDTAALYRSLVADRRLLIVLDNAATVSQVRPLLPGGGTSLVLVTSRNRLAGLAVRDGARRLTLGTLPGPEAVALLRAVTSGYRPEDNEDQLAELARLCARLPLALRIAAERAASHPHMRLEDLITDLRDESALWDTLSTGDEEDSDAVRTVFAWSYRALSPRAARLFRLLGLHPGPEFSLSAAAALGACTPVRARQLLDDLVGAHLLEQIAPDRYQFHDLLRAYATEQAQDEEPAEQREAALHRVLSWYLHTADAAQTWLTPAEKHLSLPEPEPGTHPLLFADYGAAADWSERGQDNFPHLVRAAARAQLDDLAWQLSAVLWFSRPPSAPERDWLELGRLGLEAAERLGDRNAQVRLHLNLGMAYRTLNRFDEGLDHLGTAAALARDSGNQSDRAYALNLIGLIHLRARRLTAADEHFGQAAAAFRDPDHSHLAATVLSNIAGTRLSAGRLPEAASVVEQALAAHRALGNQRGEGNALRIVAELRRELGEFDDARRAIDQALEIALGLRDHALEGFWLLTLGDIQQATGSYGDALASYQRSAMLHRRLGDRSREALAWRGAGQTYSAMGRTAEAAAFHRQAAAVHAQLTDSWQQAMELDLLATTVVTSDAQAARTHWAEALALLEPFTDPRARAVRTRIREHLSTSGA